MHHELIANPSLGEDIDTVIGNTYLSIASRIRVPLIGTLKRHIPCYSGTCGIAVGEDGSVERERKILDDLCEESRLVSLISHPLSVY
jgi:hypothetical protein